MKRPELAELLAFALRILPTEADIKEFTDHRQAILAMKNDVDNKTQPCNPSKVEIKECANIITNTLSTTLCYRYFDDWGKNAIEGLNEVVDELEEILKQ